MTREGAMKIDVNDEIAAKVGLSEREALELLAVALYKWKGIHGTLAGKILGISEIEFHQLLARVGTTVNYDVDDLVNDIKDNDL
jgi:predicted HTH domain antitoxin